MHRKLRYMPTLKLRLKRLGKKRFRNLPYLLELEVGSLRGLITACVRKEVEQFNASREEPEVLPFLGPGAIEAQSKDGKIAFGRVANPDTADAEKAVAVALQAWEDGMYAVFLGDDEVRSLDEALSLPDGTEVTFIRLTFLTGTFW